METNFFSFLVMSVCTIEVIFVKEKHPMENLLISVCWCWYVA